VEELPEQTAAAVGLILVVKLITEMVSAPIVQPFLAVTMYVPELEAVVELVTAPLLHNTWEKEPLILSEAVEEGHNNQLLPCAIETEATGCGIVKSALVKVKLSKNLKFTGEPGSLGTVNIA
jgi:hypothetical protein